MPYENETVIPRGNGVHEAAGLKDPEGTLDLIRDKLIQNMRMLVAFRSYLEDTGTGASYYEVVYDRVIVFHKKN